MVIRKKQDREGKIIIDLTGPDGNAFVLLGIAKKLTEQLGRHWPVIYKHMTIGAYEQLIKVFDEEFGDYVILER